MSEKVEGAYGAEQIQVLDGLEHIRKRPGMYISSTDERGLHHLVSEVVDNSIDEALAGYCDRVDVTINADGSCTVEDNGRGIPTEIHPKEGISTVEVVFTKVNAGGKFGGDSGYKVSSGLHGVGVKAVNALSEWLEVEVSQNGHVYKQVYNRGVPQRPLAVIGDTDKTGTKVTFFPDAEIFETIVFKYDTLRARLKELAFLNKGLTITLTDKRGEKERSDTFCYEGGIRELVEEINSGNETLFPEPLYFEEQDGTTVCEIALQYNDSYNEVIYSYANNVNTIDGGTHVDGLKLALTKVINDAGRKLNILKESDRLTGEDVREGITAVVSVKLENAQFESQTKDKLNNSFIRTFVSKCVAERFGTYIEEHPAEARELVLRCITAQKARDAARSARELTRQKGPARIERAARQARRLFRPPPRAVRDLHRRGRFGRRHGEVGARPALPGDPAPARQDPQRGEGAPQPRAGKRRDQGDDHRVRLRHSRRLRREQAALRPHHLHDGCRRRRRAYPHSAAHLPLPLYASAHRARARLFRHAAPL